MKANLVLLLISAASAQAQSPGAFTAAGSMVTPRFFHTATLLTNGKVLVAGGYTVCYLAAPCLPAARAELYDPATGIFSDAGRTATALPTGGVLLPNGRVLFAEGYFTETPASVELYDPSTGVFTVAGSSTTLTEVTSANLLNDGRVLLIGMSGILPPLVYGAELYDPASGTFSPVANWPGEECADPPLVLAGGTVLIASGDTNVSKSCVYDPATGAFSRTGTFGYFEGAPRAALLLNGGVLFTGGSDDFGSLSRAELYDPVTGAFTATESLSTARIYHSATLLPNGAVLAAGGAFQPAGSPQTPLASAEIYNPATGTFAAAGSMHSARYAHTATMLNSGQVLLAGGIATPGNANGSGSTIATSELYTPSLLVPAPALFSLSGDGQGQGAIWHAQTGGIASAGSPAVAGEALSMYTTNLADRGVIPPQVSIGGRLAEVLYFGPAGYPGYNQVNFLVPSGVTPGGAVSVRLIYLGRSSNAVTIGVQ